MLTGFQLKAARGALKIRALELAQIINVHRFTIAKLEATPNTLHLKCHTDTLLSLETFFKQNGILFLDDFSITLKQEKKTFATKKELTVFQLRAARAGLHISLAELSKAIQCNASSLCKLEQEPLSSYVKSEYFNTDLIKQYFIDKRISFPDNFTVRINE